MRTLPDHATPLHDASWRATASRAIHPSVDRVASTLVETIAAGLAAVAVPGDLTDHPPSERSFELVLATEHYDAWLIHWPAGSGIEAHDHGGSSGAFAVVAGTLDEDLIHPDGTTTARHVGPGQSLAFDGGRVHAVVNRGDVAATSVHVYAPPLRTMTFYRSADDGRPEVERVDTVTPVHT